MIIDSHHHVWQYDPVKFEWINDDLALLKRDYNHKDLQKETEALGVTGAITVQAQQTLEETKELLDQALDNDFIQGVVAWFPLQDENIGNVLDQYKSVKLKGVRHIVQAEAADFMDQKKFNEGIKELTKRGLCYDILIYEQQLEESIRLVDRHPEQIFVLDHIAKPKIAESILEPWAKNIKELAKRENVSCKISGMTTEADYKLWDESNLKPYFDVAVEAFGPKRLMFGSDWPVCLLASSYKRWLDFVIENTSSWSKDEKDALFHGSANLFYKL